MDDPLLRRNGSELALGIVVDATGAGTTGARDARDAQTVLLPSLQQSGSVPGGVPAACPPIYDLERHAAGGDRVEIALVDKQTLRVVGRTGVAFTVPTPSGSGGSDEGKKTVAKTVAAAGGAAVLRVQYRFLKTAKRWALNALYLRSDDGAGLRAWMMQHSGTHNGGVVRAFFEHAAARAEADAVQRQVEDNRRYLLDTQAAIDARLRRIAALQAEVDAFEADKRLLPHPAATDESLRDKKSAADRALADVYGRARGL